MRIWVERHRILGRLLELPPAFTLQWIRCSIRKRFVSQKQAEHLPFFFVLSTGRAGTQTLSALLNASPEAIVYHEPRPRLLALSKLAYMTDSADSRQLGAVFSELRADLINSCLSLGKGFGDTGPDVTFLAYAILEEFPHAKFVHLVREPRAVVRSSMRRKMNTGSKFDKARVITPKARDPAFAEWPHWSPFERNIWHWAEMNRHVRRFCGGLDKRSWMLFRFRDLVGGDLEKLEGLYRFLGLSIPSQRRIRRILGRKLNRQLEGQFPAPEEWTDEMNEKLEEIAGGEMKALGYA